MPQTLQTIAEISIAFAGFSGLIVAFRKKPGPLTATEKFRLQILLALAFGAMFLSLLPELLQSLEVEGQKIWVYASAASFARMAAGHVIIVFLQAAVVFSLLVEEAVAAVLAGLIWYLIHAAQQFARMLFVQPRTTAPQD